MKDRGELLLKVMHLMAEHFKDKVVLEGGMDIIIRGSLLRVAQRIEIEAK